MKRRTAWHFPVSDGGPQSLTSRNVGFARKPELSGFKGPLANRPMAGYFHSIWHNNDGPVFAFTLPMLFCLSILSLACGLAFAALTGRDKNQFDHLRQASIPLLIVGLLTMGWTIAASFYLQSVGQ
jgi:hypothetical protein